MNTNLAQLVAAAADLCRKPLRHGVVSTTAPADHDQTLLLEVRNPQGERLPDQDLELELFRSGSEGNESVHLLLSWRDNDQKPTLWHGSHPVWMDPHGMRCAPPCDGAQLEALARRLRALLDAEL